MRFASPLRAGKARLPALAALLLCGAFFSYLNAITPLAADDYYYACRLGTAADGTLALLGRLRGVGDIFPSLKRIYLCHSGRLPVLGAAQLFTLAPKAVFDLCNTLMFLALLCALLRLAAPRTPCAAALTVLAAFGLLWAATPAFGQCFLWQTGAINYLWTNAISFLFLGALWADDFGPARGPLALWFAVGLLSGWSMEHQAAAGCFLCAVRLLALVPRRQAPAPRLLAGAAGQFLGFALLMAAPGNYRRSAGYGQAGLAWALLPARLLQYTAALWRALWWLLLLTALLALLLCLLGTKAQRRCLLRLLAGAAVCHVAMTVSPAYPMRAMLGTELYLLAALLYCLNGLPKHCCRLLAAGCLALLLPFACTLPGAVSDLRAFDALTAARGATLEAQRAQGASEVTVPIAHAETKFDPFWGDALSDLMQDPENERNVALAYYYGVARVRGAPDSQG